MTGQALANSYPFLNQNTTATTLAVGATTGSGVTLTASTAIFTHTPTADYVGSIFRIDDGAGTIGAIQITGWTSTTVLTGLVIVAFGDTGAHAAWWESAWSTIRGWPRSCCIFQQRLVMAGTLHQPDTLWFSQTAAYPAFSALDNVAPPSTILPTGQVIAPSGAYVRYPVDDAQGDGSTTGPIGSQPFRITLSQNQLDQIQWLSPDKELLVGTLSQEWIVSPQNGDFSVGQSPIVLQSKYGSDYLQAQRIGYELIFPLSTGDEVRAYQYNYIDASFFAEPIQLMFDQYPVTETSTLFPGRRKFRAMEWDVTRRTLWCLDSAGNFFGMTRDRKLSTTMWHTHQFGGYDTTKGVGNSAAFFCDPAWAVCDGSVVSFCVIPNPQSLVNDVWLVVKRTIAGVSQWQIERMVGKNTARTTAYNAIAPGFGMEPACIDAAYLNNDAGNPATKTYSVGAYLNGYSLTGTYYSATNGLFKLVTGAVAAGVATLTGNLPADYGTATNVVLLGLPFTGIIQPTRLDAGSVIGTSQQALKRINRLFIDFFKTMAANVGTPPNSTESSGTMEPLNFRAATVPLNKSAELFTGYKKVLPHTQYERDGYIYITNDQPLPFAVTSVVVEGETFD